MTQPNATCRRSQSRLGLGPDPGGTESQPTKNAGRGFGLAACFLSLLLSLAGCAKLELGESFALWKSDAEPQTPESLAAVWTETTLHQPGKPVVRGFGGRILFHGGDQEQAVPVEGSVMVYAYDNDRPNPEDPAPDKKYVFPAQNMASHQSESSLGPSYSFWLPWDDAGGPQKRISLLTRFEDKSGKIVMSQMAHVTLPGPVAPPQSHSGLAQVSQPLPNPTAIPGASPGIQQASYEASPTENRQAAGLQNAPPPRSVTIDVAPGQAHRLLAASRSQAGRQQPPSSPPQATAGAGPVSLAPAAEAAGPANRQAALPTGSAPTQPQVRNPPATRPTYDPVRRQPHHVESLRRLPPTPRSGWSPSEATPLANGASADR